MQIALQPAARRTDRATDLLISARTVSVVLGGRRVLHDIDLDLAASEIVTVVGPNGSGKTTLLRALIGALPTASGTITRRADLVTGYVPQSLTLDATMPLTVQRFMNLPKAHDASDVDRVLARLGVVGLERQQMSALSGGQFQRVLLGRALLQRPNLLILDEPTQSLDQPGAADFYQLIERVRAEQDCAVLMVSHDLHVVMSASDRVICLNRHICCQGTPAHVSAAPEYRALFGTGTRGAFALYQHQHDHRHDAPEDDNDPAGHAH